MIKLFTSLATYKFVIVEFAKFQIWHYKETLYWLFRKQFKLWHRRKAVALKWTIMLYIGFGILQYQNIFHTNTQEVTLFHWTWVYNNTVKPVLSGHSKIDKTMILMTDGSIMTVKSIAECSPWSILQYFWPALSNNWSWKPIFGLFESGSFTQVLLQHYCTYEWSHKTFCHSSCNRI